MKIKLPSTLSVLYGLAILAAIWEMYTIVDKTRGNTFSATVCKLGKDQTFIPFMCGMLSGHLWREQMAIFEAGKAMGMMHWPLLDKEEFNEMQGVTSNDRLSKN